MHVVLPRSRRRAAEPPPQAFFVGSAVFHYLGPAFAVLLFARVPVLGVAWLRIVSAALVLAALRRPWRLRRCLRRDQLMTLATWSATLAAMNACFYQAIARLPLGTVAAIEFVPVVAFAAAGARTTRNAGALALAVLGVALLSDVRLAGEPLGFAFAAANAALFAAYVVLGHRVATDASLGGVDALALAMAGAAVIVTPLGGWAAAPALGDPVALLAGVGVGISSSVVPYVCDQLAMARLSRAGYALLVALLPATATVIGLVVLAQVPGPAELAAVALVVAGVALHRELDDRCHGPAGAGDCLDALAAVAPPPRRARRRSAGATARLGGGSNRPPACRSPPPSRQHAQPAACSWPSRGIDHPATLGCVRHDEPATRELSWEGCVNVRDLGGLPLAGGGRTAHGVVVRADDVNRLSSAGWAALEAYGVRRIVDLRWGAERRGEPPGAAGVEVLHIPLLGAERVASFDAKYNGYLDACDDPVEYYRWQYLEFLQEFQPSFGVAVDAVGGADGTVLVHCAAGKDRTGLVAALLLRGAGVSVQDVAEDWAASEACWAPYGEVFVASAADEVEARRYAVFNLAPAAAMVDVLEELDRRGGARAYLEDAGADPERLERLLRRLRPPA